MKIVRTITQAVEKRIRKTQNYVNKQFAKNISAWIVNRKDRQRGEKRANESYNVAFATNIASEDLLGNLDRTFEAKERKEMAYREAEQIINDEVKHAWSQSQRIQATYIHIIGRLGAWE